MVYIHLADEEKLQVLFLALALFLLALVLSVCIGSTLCPLNKWLLERVIKKRRQQQQQQSGFIGPPNYLLDNGRFAGLFGAGKLAACSGAGTYPGPPPAYEAALHATRLQALTGNLSRKSSAISFTSKSPSSLNDWLQPVAPANTELDFGDYFHQPKQEPMAVNEVANHLAGQEAYLTKYKQLQSSPVMLRIWVRMMDPGELVARARSRPNPNNSGSERRNTLSRQLSIPQLFDSLVHLAAGRRQQETAADSVWPNQADNRQQTTNLDGANRRSELQSEINSNFDAKNLNSIVSTSDSMSTTDSASLTGQMEDNSPTQEQQQQQTAASVNQVAAATGNTADLPETDSGCLEKVSTKPLNEPDHRQQQQQLKQAGKLKSTRLHQKDRINDQDGGRSAAITSRVLHMNVGSFSYVKDETIISTKKHNQMNYNHFCATNNNLSKQNSSTSSSSGSSSSYNNVNGPSQSPKQPPGSKSKFCQLVISICDVENIMNLSWLNERSCALLANNSAIYVQCEILLPKSKAGQLLAYPLRALQQSVNGQSSHTTAKHTINFESSIPAAVIEPQRALIGSQLTVDSTSSSSVTGDSSAADSSLAFPPNQTSNQPQPQSQQQVAAAESYSTSTNWSHEPDADGASIVSFNSIPKQVAHQQQMAASFNHQLYQHQQAQFNDPRQQQQQQHHQLSPITLPAPDLIQFDSVFVSPILSRSTIEEGFIRFRIYSQCKYVNETCLAELKLPLKQLLRSETGDNLGDATRMQYQFDSLFQPQQADFILNNVLANLVTAATSSPLSTLIEQISFEEEADEVKGIEKPLSSSVSASATAAAAVINERRAHSFKLPWLNCGSLAGQRAGIEQEHKHAKLRASASFNESLHRLTSERNFLQNEEQIDRSRHHQQVISLIERFGSRFNNNNNNNNNNSDRLNRDYERDFDDQEEQLECDRERERQSCLEQNYCRSLMVSHWLNYLVAPSYKCQLVEESRGKIILGLSYLPTSNRVIFNAHRASIDTTTTDSCLSGASAGKQMLMKKLRLQSSTCYLLRFFMVVNGNVLKRKQTPVARKAEWDSQEPITFDLVSISVEQPSFVVALVMRNANGLGGSRSRQTAAAINNTGSLQNLQQMACCHQVLPAAKAQYDLSKCDQGATNLSGTTSVQSEPEPSKRFSHSTNNGESPINNGQSVHRTDGGLYRGDLAHCASAYCSGAPVGAAAGDCPHQTQRQQQQQQQHQQQQQRHRNERDLVIGHLVLGDEMWREMRSKPRKQIVRQFKIY